MAEKKKERVLLHIMRCEMKPSRTKNHLVPHYFRSREDCSSSKHAKARVKELLRSDKLFYAFYISRQQIVFRDKANYLDAHDMVPGTAYFGTVLKKEEIAKNTADYGFLMSLIKKSPLKAVVVCRTGNYLPLFEDMIVKEV